MDLLFALVLEWFGYKIIMITKSVNASDILIFSFVYSLLCDTYFMIILPFFWIFTSWKGNWAGWTNGSRTRSRFHLTLKPANSKGVAKDRISLEVERMSEKHVVHENVVGDSSIIGFPLVIAVSERDMSGIEP